MNELYFVKGYHDEEEYRKSLSDLALTTFGISFENWYKHGFWNEQYVPYSYHDGKRIVANVSIHHLKLLIGGESYRAAQIGTVMTHPEYRHKGLSQCLMEKVLFDVESSCDLLYLFANQTVLDYYPRFGFKSIPECIYCIEYSFPLKKDTTVRQLNGKDKADLDFIYRIASNRIPLSEMFSTANGQRLLMFYCLEVFYNDIYYLEEEHVIVIFTKEDNRLDVIDIISDTPISIRLILEKIAGEQIKKVYFHFTPDDPTLSFTSFPYYGDEMLFVKSNDMDNFPLYIKHPLTSQG